ncbi:MAG: ATP-binding cassette domain-containing protein [Actinobacteria bacterium]|nr:ATP-binding cassette domain-containing protein [Actinomycetota bacterium]
MFTLSVRDLVVEYEAENYKVRPIEGLSFEASEGEIVVLLGPSSSGKTTLLSCLAGILTPTWGWIEAGGTVVTELGIAKLGEYRRRQVGIIFQAFNLIQSLSARENVAMPLLVGGGIFRNQVPLADALKRADELLALVNLSDRAHHKPRQLSGGQQQRVAIARALIYDPPMLLADEPTANLDYIQAEGIVRALRDLKAKGRIIVIATHDERLVPIADRVVQLVPDVHGESGPPQNVEYAAGETIFRQGSRGQLIYVIQKGKVDLFRELADGGEEPLAELDAGQYFGELGPFLGMPRAATARAKSDVVLRAYGVQDFRRQLAEIQAAAENGSKAKPRKATTKKAAAKRAAGGKPASKKAPGRKAPAKR